MKIAGVQPEFVRRLRHPLPDQPGLEARHAAVAVNLGAAPRQDVERARSATPIRVPRGSAGRSPRSFRAPPRPPDREAATGCGRATTGAAAGLCRQAASGARHGGCRGGVPSGLVGRTVHGRAVVACSLVRNRQTEKRPARSSAVFGLHPARAGQHAAVDHDRLARDVGRGLRAQQQHDAYELLGEGKPARGNEVAEPRRTVLVVP